MKIKAFIFIILLSLLVITITSNANPQQANISRADIAIGGINLGAEEIYVRNIYGEPNKTSYKEKGPFGRTKIFQYGDSFFVTFSNNNGWHVLDVKSTGNNGLKTPVGFTVGMNLSDVRDYYGKGRGDENHLAYTANQWCNIMFTAKNGKITEIHIYITP